MQVKMFPLTCRVCLGGDMKMYSIEKYTFKEIFERIIKFDLGDGLPNTLCYICVSQLQRCRRLSDMAHKSSKALVYLFNNGIEISHSKITALELSTVHPLAVTALPPLTVINHTEATSLIQIKEEQEIETSEKETVKTEDGTIEIELNPTSGLQHTAWCNQENGILSPLICRICLSGNVKIYKFGNNDLKEIFQKVTSLELKAGYGMPNAACYICVSQLQRCRRFSARAHESARVLTCLRNNGFEISRKTINAFNLGLSSANNLSVKVLPQLTVTDDSVKGSFLVEVKPDNLIPFNKIKDEIKVEIVKREKAEENNSRMVQVEINGPTIKLLTVRDKYFRYSHNQFVCKICNRKFISKMIMLKHLRFHKEKPVPLQENKEINYFRDSDKRFVCKLCNRKCVAKLTIIKHLRLHEEKTFSPQESDDTDYFRDSNKQFVCKICDKKCKSKKTIINHLKVHTEGKSIDQKKTQDGNEISYFRDSDKQFACKLCDKKVKTKKAIINHIKYHTGEKPLAKTEEISETKYFRDSDKKFVCKICQRKCVSKITMTKHVKVHPDGEEPYIMEQLNIQTYEDSYFRDSDKKLVCKICNRKCTSKCTVIKHIRIHTGEKPYVCDVCHRSFKQTSSLNYHKQSHDPEKPRRKKLRHLVCETCNKVFSQVSHLKVHKLRHTGKRPFSCSTCNKCFSQAAHLWQHTRLHTGDKPFTCQVCSVSFARSDYLKKHLLLHTGDTQVDKICDNTEAGTSKMKVQASLKKSLVCKYCAKAFSQSKDVKLHELIHTGDRPYVCDVCAKSFNHPGTLKNHKRLHSGEKPHVCHICSKSFVQSTNLKRHLLTHSNPKRRRKIKEKVIDGGEGTQGTDRQNDDGEICP